MIGLPPKPAISMAVGEKHGVYHGIVKQVVSNPVPMYVAGVAKIEGDAITLAHFEPTLLTFGEAMQAAEVAAVAKDWEGVITWPKHLYPEPEVVKS
jgi:hypothetical protein